MIRRPVQSLVVVLAAMSTLALNGCVSFGPSTIPRDRFDYVSTISDSWKSQMLLNIVKLRYADTPAFLEVGSVISQYEFAGELNATLGWGLPLPGSDSQSIGGQELTLSGQPLPMLRLPAPSLRKAS